MLIQLNGFTMGYFFPKQEEAKRAHASGVQNQEVQRPQDESAAAETTPAAFTALAPLGLIAFRFF